MKKNYFFIILFIFFISIFLLQGFGYASGILTVSGKLVSITEQEFAIETKTSVYSINRKAVSPDESKLITRTEVPVSLHVGPEAILRVKKIH